MMNRRIFALVLMVSFLGFVSCKKDNNDKPSVSIQESKDNLNNLAADMQKDLNVVYDESGWLAANNFVSLMSIEDPIFGGSFIKKSTGEKLSLKSLFKLNKLKSDNPVVFTDYVGTYTWNAANQGWDITQNSPSDKVVFIFPAESPTSVNNNVTLTLYDYQEVEVTETDEFGTWTYYEPTVAHADLVINDVKYLELTFSAAWNTTTGDPQNVNVSLFVKPYTLSLTMGQQNKTGNVEFILEEGDTRVCSVGADITFETDALDIPQSLTGYVQYRNVKLAGDINVAAIDGLETDPTADFLNQNVNLAFYSYPEESKFADVEFNNDGFDGAEGPGITIAFTDGTTMDGAEFINELMTAFNNYVPQGPAK